MVQKLFPYTKTIVGTCGQLTKSFKINCSFESWNNQFENRKCIGKISRGNLKKKKYPLIYLLQTTGICREMSNKILPPPTIWCSLTSILTKSGTHLCRTLHKCENWQFLFKHNWTRKRIQDISEFYICKNTLMCSPLFVLKACALLTLLTYLFTVKANFIKAFHKVSRYNTRPLRLNWGPENVHFGKKHFRDPNINARIFIYFVKFKELPGATLF